MFIDKTRVSIASFASLALCCVLAAPRAVALGFGDVRAAALLGQPLNIALPVNLSEGETLTNDCVSAEVQSGDSRLPPGTVRARVTQGRDASEAIVRISTTLAIDEPIVTLTISAGCPTRITRTLTLLADPPLGTATAPTVAAPAAPAQNLPRTAATAPRAEGGAASASPERASRPSTPQRATARSAAAPRGAAPNTVDAADPTNKATPSRPPRTAARAAPPPPSEAEARPRLQLDSGAVAAAPAAVLAAEAQASAARDAARVAEAAASAAQQRIKEMEGEVARLRADSKAQTDALVELRKQLAQDRNRASSEAGWWMPALLALAALLGVTSLWLAWRLKQQQRVRVTQRDAWYERGSASSMTPSVHSAQDDDEDEGEDSDMRRLTPSRIPSTLPPPVAAKPRPATTLQPAPSMFDTKAGGLDSMISPPTMPAHTMVTLPSAAIRIDDDESVRAVSVDEQIDLEQQADFFIALGHDESAIDLLMAHLRSTGGGTPLPFLKLLEIHRRRGDRDAYERTRVRFNQRFNSVAPEWQGDPKAGRLLEDYPLVVGRIQGAWPTPLDAMAELEALLFRRGAGSELFELPAYQELLFLYQTARDLHQQSQPNADNDVDVLLPIGTDMAPLMEGAISLKPEFNGGQPVTLDLERPATLDKPSLDFDLGDDDKPLGKRS
jgi:pilus assembly protein FimV